jgi:hypothetical protein
MKKKLSKMVILTLIMKCLLNRDLEGATDFTSESWNSSNSCTTNVTELYECGDTGLLIAFIILAVILFLLLVGVAVVYLRYVRSVF